MWRLEMATQDKGDLDAEDAGRTVHNSTTATLRRPRNVYAYQINNSEETATVRRVYELRCTPYHDEFDAHYHRRADEDDGAHGHHIPLRSALNFFGRARMTAPGGPDALRRM